MPRTRYHASIEAQRKAKQQTTNQEVTAMTTTNETNGNGQVLQTANLNKLASALSENYQPEATTVEDLLFADKPICESLLNLSKLLGANHHNLAALLVADSLEGKGEISKLLRLLSDDIKQKQLDSQKRLIEEQKQALLNKVQELDVQLGLLSVGSLI